MKIKGRVLFVPHLPILTNKDFGEIELSAEELARQLSNSEILAIYNHFPKPTEQKEYCECVGTMCQVNHKGQYICQDCWKELKPIPAEKKECEQVCYICGCNKGHHEIHCSAGHCPSIKPEPKSKDRIDKIVLTNGTEDIWEKIENKLNELIVRINEREK